MLLRALVAAREASLRQRVARSISAHEVLVTEVSNRRELRQRLRQEPHDLVLLERYLLSGSTELVDAVRCGPESPEVIVLAEREDPEERAALLAAGCLAVIYKGLSDDALSDALAALTARRRSEATAMIQRIPDEQYRLGDYASKSRAMKRFLETARRVAARDSTLLILGETGVGKGLLARSIHNEGSRAQCPFVAVNCGALTETLLESELFGHKKGSFTGAIYTRRGHFELAHRGTIFLDEITELPLHLQVKLLNVLEKKKVQPLGSEEALHVDVRIIAASNRDVEAEVQDKRFRGDLYYRLNVVSLRLPSLRERREDIPDLAQSYVDHFRARIGTEVVGIEKDALAAMLEYSWPGNVRELINVIERAVLLSPGGKIGLDDLPEEIGAAARAYDPWKAARHPQTSPDWLERPWADARRQVLEEVERLYLAHQLEEVHGHVGEAAARAGIDPRSLYEKMKHHGLRKEDFRRRKPDANRTRPNT